MRVCIIQFPTLNLSSHGVLQTVKNIKASGHEVILIGSNSFNGIDEIWEYKKELLLTTLLRFKPDVVGFSVMTPYADYIEQVAKFIKYYCPKASIVVGGNHVYAVREKILEENPSVDYIYLGESEAGFSEFLKSLQNIDGFHTQLPCIGSRSGDKYKINKMMFQQEHKDILTYQAFDYIAPEFDVYRGSLFKYRIVPVLLTRGCPYQCTYCANAGEDSIQKKVRFIDPGLFEEQLLDLKKNRVSSLLIDDAEFNLNKSWAFKIMDIMKKHNVSLCWVNARIDLVTEDFIRRVKELNIQEVSMPIESGSPRIRNNVFNRKVSDEQIYAAFKYAKKHNVLCSTNVIVGAPTEKKEDMEMTRDMLLKIDADAPNLKTLVPLPGTILFEKYKSFIRWNSYSQFNLAHDTEDTLFLKDFPRCEFDMNIETFYEEFKMLDALIHPLSIILRRKFNLEGKKILFFANCGLIEAIEIVKMFLVSKAEKVTIALSSAMPAGYFERYPSVEIKQVPDELMGFEKNRNIERNNRYDLLWLLEALGRRSKILNGLIELMRSLYRYARFFISKPCTQELVDFLKDNKLISEMHDYFFFVKKRNTNPYRKMIYLGRLHDFKEVTGLNKDELSFYQMNFEKILKINKIKYHRKMGGGKQRLYRKHIQQG